MKSNLQTKHTYSRVVPYLLSMALLALAVVVAVTQQKVSSASVRALLALLFELIILGNIGYFAGRYAKRELDALGYTTRERRKIGVTLVVFALLFMLFIIFFVSNERVIRVYDFSLYWTKVIEDSELITQSIPQYLTRLIGSLSEEYGRLPVFALLPFSQVFGNSFLVYTLSIYMMYYLPACFFLTLYTARLGKMMRYQKSMLHIIIVFIAFLLNGQLIFPMLNGYLDVVGVVIFSIMLNLSFRWKVYEFNYKQNIVMTVLSVLLILSRRWYAYLIVGFYVSLLVITAIYLIRHNKWNGKAVLHTALNIGMIGVLSLAIILVLNANVLQMFFANNYTTAYSAYKAVDFGMTVRIALRRAGVLYLLGCAVGLAILLKNADTRYIAFRLLLLILIPFGLFSIVQSFGGHHYYLFVPTLGILFGCCSFVVIEKLMQEEKLPWSIAFCTVIIFNFCFCFIPQFRYLQSAMAPFTSGVREYPEVDDDNIERTSEILRDLKERIQYRSDKVYVVGADAELSIELFKKINLPQEIDAAPFVLTNSIVDLRDGFPSQLFLAKYVLLMDPIRQQPELNEMQQISLQVYELIMEDPTYKDHFKLIKRYAGTDEDILLFERQEGSTLSLVQELSDRLKTFYPDDALVYEPDYFLSLLKVDSDQDYTYYFWDKMFMFINRDYGEMSFSLDETNQFRKLSFSIDCDSNYTIQVYDENGLLFEQSYLDSGVPIEIDISSNYVDVHIKTDTWGLMLYDFSLLS